MKSIFLSVLVVLASIVYGYILVQQNVRLVFVGIFFFILLMLSFKFETGTIALLFFYPFMGIIRRYIYRFNIYAKYDPLLVIPPALVLLIFLNIIVFNRKAFASIWRKDPIFKYIGFLILIMIIQAFNPLQGNILVGFGGLMFFMLPIFWFFFGYFMDNLPIERLYKWLVIVAVIVSIYGLKQTFFGFTPFEMYWLQHVKYTSVHIGATYRPFSTLTSVAGYSYYVYIGAFISFVLALRKRNIFYFIAFLFLAGNLLIISVRFSIFALLFSIFIYYSFSLKSLKKMFVTDIIGSIVILFFIYNVKMVNITSLGGAFGTLFAHSISGLVNPFAEKSTLWIHILAWKYGLIRFAHNIIGYGIGAVTIASRKFGGLTYAPESDLIGILVGLGIIGFIAFMLVIYRFSQIATRLSFRYDNFTARIHFVLILSFVFIINNFTSYSCGALFWFLMGITVRDYIHTIEEK